MIQEIITRMGHNSFSLKEWSVGTMIAIFAFAGDASGNGHKAVIITVIPLIIFWLLDAYYLTLEKKFRALYDKIRNFKENEIDFSMNVNDVNLEMKDVRKYGFFNTLISKSVMTFYIVCIATAIFLYFMKF